MNYQQLIAIIDDWIATKSNNQALELFAEIRRIWRFGAPLFCNGKNVASLIADDYVSSRVQRPQPTRLFTDLDAISELYINVAATKSIHQKNAIRFMIMTGVRPVNITNLMWKYVADDLSEIVYPSGVVGIRGAMKSQKEFRIPVTASVRTILKEQMEWRDSVADCNKEYVFLQPSDPKNAFSKRSLVDILLAVNGEDSYGG